MKHIELFDIHFWYEKGGAPVLSGIEFAVEKGGTLCIAGANGSGKSTLLELIAGTLKPTKGSIVVHTGKSEANGVAHNESKPASDSVAHTTGIVFQEPDHQLFMPTVCEDVMFGILKKGVKPEEARQAALEALRLVEAEHLADRPPYKLSGGEKQRAALAGVLITRPEILVLDEPTAALDPRARKNLIALLKTIGCTKIIASHDLDMALDLAGSVLFLHHGTVAAQSPVPGLLADEPFLQSIGLELPLSQR